MRLLSTLVVLIGLSTATSAEPDKDGYVPLFNGKDLSNWVNVNTHPKTFFVKDNEIVTTGQPTGFLRYDKQFENFIMEFDWMHVEKTKMANSGLFVWGDALPAIGTPYTRGIEVQVLINFKPADGWATSHGDIFSIHGARCVPDRPHPKGIERCLPSEERVKGGGEWNHYKVTANDGSIKLEVNGKEVSGVSKSNPRKGYLALESEGVECHFKNLKIKELPSTNPKPEEIATEAKGHKLLFNTNDLEGWVADKAAWKAGGGVLRAVGTEPITTEAKFGKVEMLFDWKIPAKATGEPTVSVGTKTVTLKSKGKAGGWSREIITADGADGPITIKPIAGLELMSVYVRELK